MQYFHSGRDRDRSRPGSGPQGPRRTQSPWRTWSWETESAHGGSAVDGKSTATRSTSRCRTLDVDITDVWQDFPRELQWMTYLKEWHVSRTRIQKLPDYLALFTQLTVMDVPKNAIAELPPEIGEAAVAEAWAVYDPLWRPPVLCRPPGKLTELRELNVSYNQLSKVPPELGNCEKLEKLELAGNRSLSELPFEVSAVSEPAKGKSPQSG